MEAVSKLPVRNGRGQRTRAALIAAGHRLFAEHPVDAVAIDDIVQAASVAKGSFYTHFPDKDGLLDAVVLDIRSSIESRIRQVNADESDPAARIVRALCVYAGRVGEEPAHGHILLRNLHGGSADAALNEGLRRDLSDGLHGNRLLLPSVETGMLFVIGAVHSALLSAVHHRDRGRAISDTQQICMLLLRGFGLFNVEAERIAAQAADHIIAMRGFED